MILLGDPLATRPCKCAPAGYNTQRTARWQTEDSPVYKKILVPIDGSEPATRGLAEAVKLAQNLGAAIRLLHVVNGMIAPSAHTYGANVAWDPGNLRTVGASLLKEAEAAVRGAGIEVDTALIEAASAPAGEEIVRQANTWPADLIICGTHGRRGIRRLVMGSDAEFIIRHTPVPVLVLRSPGPAIK